MSRNKLHPAQPPRKPRERWTLVFEAAGDGPPAAIRVRRLLKCALRSFGLRLVSYGDEPTDPKLSTGAIASKESP